MKKILFGIIAFVGMVIFASCNVETNTNIEQINTPTEDITTQTEQVDISTIDNKIKSFEEKLKDADSYIYTNNVDVIKASGDGHISHLYKRKINIKVDNINDVFELNENNYYANRDYYAYKNNNIYEISHSGSNAIDLDFMYYKSNIDEFVDYLEDVYSLNINARKQVVDIESEISGSNNDYKIKYKLSDFTKVFKDKNIEKYCSKIGDVSDDAFVTVSYFFVDHMIMISHYFDYDGIPDNNGPAINLMTRYEILPVEIESFKKDTLSFSLTDINSEEIADATGFTQIYLKVDSSDKGFFKIYLEEAKYYLSLNVFNYPINPNNIEYEIYDENKQKIEKTDQYNLKSGYYYIYINQQNRFPIVINKMR